MIKVLVLTALFLICYGCSMSQEKLEKDASCYVIRYTEPFEKKEVGKVYESKFRLLDICPKRIEGLAYQEAKLIVKRDGKEIETSFDVIKVFADLAEAVDFALKHSITDAPFFEHPSISPLTKCQIIRMIGMPLRKKNDVETTPTIALLDVCLPPEAHNIQHPVITFEENGKQVTRIFEVIKTFASKEETELYAKENGITDVQLYGEENCQVIRKILPVAKRDIGDAKLEKFVLYEICRRNTEDYLEDIFVVKDGVTKSAKAKLVKTFASGQEARQYAKDLEITDTPFAEIADCQIIRVLRKPRGKTPQYLTEPRITLLATCFELEHLNYQVETIDLTRLGKKEVRKMLEIRVFKDKREAEFYAKENGLFDVDYSEDTELGRIDKELTQAFQAKRMDDYTDESIKRALEFKNKLKTYLKNPLTFNNTLINLSNEITVRTSPDKKLKFYSWDNETGGTYHTFTVIAQYQTADGKLNVKELNEAGLSEISKQTDFSIYKIHEIKLKTKTYYLTFGWGTHGNGHQFDIVQVFKIEKFGLVKDESILSKNRDLYINYARAYKSNLAFNPVTNEISYQEFIQDKDSGFMMPTGKIITLKLINGKFIQK